MPMMATTTMTSMRVKPRRRAVDDAKGMESGACQG
jgi:hypothetical protein